jgi:hypothetical protein
MAQQKQYRKVRLLGEGSNGKCYLANEVESETNYVLKQIDISKLNDTEK